MDRRGDPRTGSRTALGARARAGERLRRALRPPRTLRPTRAGWLFFALTLGVGFAAMNTGNNLLYMVLSLLLAFLVLSGVLSESALRGLRVRRRLPREAFAERPARVAVEIHNDQRRIPSFAVVVEDLVGDRVERGTPAGRVFAFRVGPGETEARSYALWVGQRGELDFAGFRVTTRFPFGLFSKSMRVPAPDALLVYPAVAPRPLGAGAPTGGTGRPGGSLGPESPEAAGLREYAPGDPFRRVHWRASLRRGALWVRARERERRAETEVRLRTRGVTPGQAFEAAVCRAASEVAVHLEAGWRVALRTDALRLPAGEGPRQRRRLLAFLARVVPEREAREASA